MPRFTANPDVIYLGDNGRSYCGEHLGNCAKTTGRDLSGQKLMAVTPEVLAEAEADGWTPKCERCKKTPSRLVLL